MAEEYEPEVGEWEGLDSQALQKASILPPHFIPHLVVHGNALPMLKVAAVGASSSRACARRHLPCPGPRRPPRRPSAARKPAGCGTSSATPIAAQFRKNNFRPLCPRRTDSVITFPAPAPGPPRAWARLRARSFSRHRPDRLCCRELHRKLTPRSLSLDIAFASSLRSAFTNLRRPCPHVTDGETNAWMGSVTFSRVHITVSKYLPMDYVIVAKRTRYFTEEKPP